MVHIEIGWCVVRFSTKVISLFLVEARVMRKADSRSIAPPPCPPTASAHTSCSTAAASQQEVYSPAIGWGGRRLLVMPATLQGLSQSCRVLRHLDSRVLLEAVARPCTLAGRMKASLASRQALTHPGSVRAPRGAGTPWTPCSGSRGQRLAVPSWLPLCSCRAGTVIGAREQAFLAS